MFEKVSRSLKYDSNIFSTTDIYMDTTVDHFTPLALRVRGNDVMKFIREGEPLFVVHARCVGSTLV